MQDKYQEMACDFLTTLGTDGLPGMVKLRASRPLADDS